MGFARGLECQGWARCLGHCPWGAGLLLSPPGCAGHFGGTAPTPGRGPWGGCMAGVLASSLGAGKVLAWGDPRVGELCCCWGCAWALRGVGELEGHRPCARPLTLLLLSLALPWCPKVSLLAPSDPRSLPSLAERLSKPPEDEGLVAARSREGQRLPQHYRCAGSAGWNCCPISSSWEERLRFATYLQFPPCCVCQASVHLPLELGRCQPPLMRIINEWRGGD